MQIRQRAIALVNPKTWEVETSLGHLLKDQVPSLRRWRSGTTFYNIRVYPQILNYLTLGVFYQMNRIKPRNYAYIAKSGSPFGLETSIKQLISVVRIDFHRDPL